MINFITDNIGTIAVSIILAAAVILACVKLYRNKKAGKSYCGGNCGGCPHSSDCGKSVENGSKNERT